jgi:hypothetical protein
VKTDSKQNWHYIMKLASITGFDSPKKSISNEGWI